MDSRATEIANRARRLDPADRLTYLDEACADDAALRAEVDALLAAEDHLTAPTLIADTPRADGAAEQPGQTIDRYRLIEPLGEGGFGTVWLAEQQEPVRRQVALKVIKLGMDTRQVIARFEAERQALAVMDHPGIAKVFDAGATGSGRPYFVMELVRGVPLVEYCDREQLDTRQRLDLFVGICRAIQHAHQKGIIHRDLKPSNVLVALADGRPVPKVIDFGIAKATDTEQAQKTFFTEQHQIIGTPAYMSPEQAALTGADIDTRSDIYALGVLLYELLVGTTPFEARDLLSKGFAEMVRIIREEEPRKPSTRLSELGETATRAAASRRADVRRLSTLLRGDLDWIVMKCLEKDRARRYESAAGLAEDIARHLGDQPVSAGPPSARYRLRKFVRRNRGRVVAASVVAATLVLGVIGTSVGLAWALREKERAMAAEEAAAQRADELELVSAFQASQLGEIDPELMGIRLRQDLLAKRRETVRGRGLDEQAVAAALAELSGALSGVNFTDVALTALDENIFERALVAIAEQFAEQPLVEARLLQTLAVTMRDLGLLERALAPQQEALEIRRRVSGDGHPETLDSISELGTLLYEQGRYDEAERYGQEALEGRRALRGDDHPETLLALGNLGVVLEVQGRLEEAEACYRQALAGSRRLLGDEHPETLISLNNLGSVLDARGAFDEAESCYREALDARRRVLGDEHPQTLASVNNLGVLRWRQGKPDEAEVHLREVLAASRRSLGDDHPNTVASLNNLGAVLKDQGRFDEAEPCYREALETRRRVLGRDHPETLGSLNNLGVLLFARGRSEAAEACLREVYETNRRVRGDEHLQTQYGLWDWACLLDAMDRPAEAEALGRRGLAVARRVFGDDHPEAFDWRHLLAKTRLAQGFHEEAEPLLRAVVEFRRRVHGPDHPATLDAVGDLVASLVRQGKQAEADRVRLELERVED